MDPETYRRLPRWYLRPRQYSEQREDHRQTGHALRGLLLRPISPQPETTAGRNNSCYICRLDVCTSHSSPRGKMCGSTTLRQTEVLPPGAVSVIDMIPQPPAWPLRSRTQHTFVPSLQRKQVQQADSPPF